MGQEILRFRAGSHLPAVLAAIATELPWLVAGAFHLQVRGFRRRRLDIHAGEFFAWRIPARVPMNGNHQDADHQERQDLSHAPSLRQLRAACKQQLAQQ
jgi:hypothetical protein